jgi:transporter family-2 protein
MRLDFLATVVGLLIAVQSRANGELSVRLDNALEAAVISFGSGLLIILVISPFHAGIKQGLSKLRGAIRSGAISRWRLVGGILGGLLLAVQTKIVPVIGVAIYSVTMIAGQTAASLLVDRVGLASGGQKPISFRRVLAAVITVLAVLISVWDRIDAKNLSLFAVFMGVFAGFFIGVQRALNGQVNEKTEQSFATSFVNFALGTLVLLVMMIVGLMIHSTHLTRLNATPWWMYLGGISGLIYIAFSSTVVQHIGVLSFTLFSVGGQLIGSLLFDLFLPTKGVHVGPYLVSGIVIAYVGVLTNNETLLKGHKKAPVSD